MGAPHECLLLEYAGGDRLYLPVENIELLSRYGHDEGLLDKLGGGAWQAKKAKLKERIRQIADKLIRVAAERELRRAPILQPPGDMWEAFCARFPYEETDDQLAAIADVMSESRGRTPDGSAGGRRRGLRQDRGRNARGLRRGGAGVAGGGDRAHHAAGAPACQDVFRTGSGAFRSRSGS